MQGISRRQIFVLTGAAVVAAAIPTVPAAAVAAPAPIDLKAWAVGTPGEFDWQFIRARTADEAIKAFAVETVGGDGCEEEDAGSDGCSECEWCLAMGAAAERKPMWDDKTNLLEEWDKMDPDRAVTMRGRMSRITSVMGRAD